MRNEAGEIVEIKNELGEDNYNIEEVVEKMLARRDRKIPGTVYKPHSQTVLLLQSMSLGQQHASARVYFVYPKYCFKDDFNTAPKGLEVKGVQPAQMR
jgi:hypothetical protein